MVPSEFPSDDHIVDKLRGFYLAAQRMVDRIMRQHGASYARTKMLLAIAREGPMRSTDLAAAFGQAPRTITEAIDGLEREGLVRRDPDPYDRRAKQVSVTPAGHDAMAASEPSRRAFVESLLQVLDPAERRAFSALLDKLNDRLQALDAGASPSGQQQDHDGGDEQRDAARQA